MKETALTQKHIDLGAKMADFAGFNMPITYAGLKEEHHCVRNNVGVFDVSHMGEFIVRGKQAFDFVQFITSNDVSKLNIGDVQYSCFPNTSGGIVDDLLVYRLPEDNCAEGEQAFMLVVNGANIDKDWAWIKQYHDQYDTALINISDETGLLAVQGPKAVEALQSLTDVDLASIKYYNFRKGTFAGLDNVVISATGYTGSGGFELYVQSGDLEALWNKVFEAGKNFDMQPCGLGARDTLRLEMGYCLYGNDITDETSPLEAGLGWITKLKSTDFVNKAYFVQQKADGLKRRLVGFKVDDRRVPRQGYEIMNAQDEVIGHVTSGTLSPSLGYPIGMGYVPTAYFAKETEIFINAGRKKLKATVIRPPFFDVNA